VLTRFRHAGFTLIELVIGLAIAALLTVLSLPMLTTWIADNAIQVGAESVASGLRYAMSTAVSKNEAVEFTLNPTTATGGWTVWTVAAPATTLQSGRFAEGAVRDTFTVVPGGATRVTFNGLAQVVPNADASNSITRVRVTNPSVAGSRPLEVWIAGQRVKMCDPAFIAPDPKGC